MEVNRIAAIVLAFAFGTSMTFAGGSKDTGKIPDKITVVSREAGSGTRDTFIKLFGVERKINGREVDRTLDSADIINSTDNVVTTVAKNNAAIGYISLGSLNDTVRAVKIDGTNATVANIKSGSYRMSRPFNIITKKNKTSKAADEFIRYILSSDGQSVIEKNGYIPSVKNPPYMVNVETGKVTLAGSSSVFPVMEKLAEAFKTVNPGITVKLSHGDSTTGVSSVIQETYDIGMASRNLKGNELFGNIKSTVIAMDGIAVIVNRKNPVIDISKGNILKIYTGEITKWSQVK